jgi:hypothetical protein
MKGWAADVLYGIPKIITYEDALQALEDFFGDQLFAAVIASTKNEDKACRRIPAEFFTAVEQLVHRAYPTLPEGHIGKSFSDWVHDHEIKVALLLGGERTVYEALSETLELLAVFLAGSSYKTRTKIFWGSRSSPTNKGTQGNRNTGSVENRATSRVPAQKEGRK